MSFPLRLVSPALPTKGLAHGFFTRLGGVSDGLYASLNVGLRSQDDLRDVVENRRRVAAAMQVPQTRLCVPKQVSAINVIVVDNDFDTQNPPVGDALVTRQKGAALGLLTADCGPILFADLEAGVIGAAHAGWKGALYGVIEETVAAMEKLGAKRSAIKAVLGPMIRQESYEVGQDFLALFLNQDPENEKLFIPSPFHGTRFMFDLPRYVMERITATKIAAAESINLCTYANPALLFSSRKMEHEGQGDYGRQISAIVMT